MQQFAKQPIHKVRFFLKDMLTFLGMERTKQISIGKIIIVQKLCLIFLSVIDNYCGSNPQWLCDSFFPPKKLGNAQIFFPNTFRRPYE